MFPLLSRLPQLSLKRGSQSTCLLIHLKLCNNRGTPPLHPAAAVSPSMSPLCRSSSHRFFPHFPASNFYSWRCSPGKTHSASVSALVRSLCTCFASSLASPLSSTWVLQREPPSRRLPAPTPPSPIPHSLLHAQLQGTGRGKTQRVNILDCTLPGERRWFDVPCVVRWTCFCFFCFFLALYRRTVCLGCVNVAMSETPRSAVEIKRPLVVNVFPVWAPLPLSHPSVSRSFNCNNSFVCLLRVGGRCAG